MVLKFSLGNEVVLASHNEGKIKELEAMLSPHNIKVKGGPDFRFEEPEENGDTFEENSLIKARFFVENTGRVSLADDSGLVIPELNGDPGIYSARWAGKNKDFTVAFERIREECDKHTIEMEGLEAYFVCVISVVWPEGKTECFEGRVYGTLTRVARGENGFGYDPIFIPEGHDKTFAELPADIKAGMSHRGKAMEQLLKCVE